jgi:hypothetical protein
LTFGGYEGENKMEMYNLLPPKTYPRSILVSASLSSAEVAALVSSQAFTFPMAVKPDVGRMGLMFRKVKSLSELLHYHERMKADYILQDFIDYPMEVSVFYYRFPGEHRGTISGFVRKECLSVKGDGTSTLYQLMLNYPRIQFRLDEMKIKHAAMLGRIIPAGERFVLSDAFNLSRGGKLVSLESEKDEKLLRVFDELSHFTGFHFGRYDIKCESIDDIRNRKNFSILEFNGSGAEPHHVYGNGNSFLRAIRILLSHWNILYKISIENRKRGIPCWTFARGLRHMQTASKQISMLRQLEFSLPETLASSDFTNSTKTKVVMPQYADTTR